MPQQVWKTREFDNLWHYSVGAVCNQNTDGWVKGCILSLPKKGDLGLAKNQDITLTFIAAKIHNALLCNCIKPKIGKNQNGFSRNRSTMSRILKGVCVKRKTKETQRQQYCRLWLHTQRKDGANTTRLSKETIAAIMMLYRNTKVKVCFLDRDTDYFNIVAGVLQGHISSILLYYLSRLCTWNIYW